MHNSRALATKLFVLFSPLVSVRNLVAWLLFFQFSAVLLHIFFCVCVCAFPHRFPCWRLLFFFLFFPEHCISIILCISFTFFPCSAFCSNAALVLSIFFSLWRKSLKYFNVLCVDLWRALQLFLRLIHFHLKSRHTSYLPPANNALFYMPKSLGSLLRFDFWAHGELKEWETQCGGRRSDLA